MKTLITVTALAVLTAACSDSVTEPELRDTDQTAPMLGRASRKPGKIVFASNRDGNRNIYIMNQDGTNQVQLTNTPEVESQPAVSPDGSQIVYVRDAELWLMNVRGSNQHFLAYGTQPAWSPKGNQIAFARMVYSPTTNTEIFVIRPSGSGEYRVTNNSADDTDPTWSPDGAELAFVSDRGSAGTDIYRVASNSVLESTATQVTFNGGIDPAWSPQGGSIAFSSFRSHPIAHENQIYLVDVATGLEERVTFQSTFDDTSPAWSPSGSHIVFVRDKLGSGAQLDLYMLDMAFYFASPLDDDSDRDEDPSWGPAQ